MKKIVSVVLIGLFSGGAAFAKLQSLPHENAFTNRESFANEPALVRFMQEKTGREYVSFSPYMQSLLEASKKLSRAHTWTAADHYLFELLHEAALWADFSYDVHDPLYQTFHKEKLDKEWKIKVHHYKGSIINVVVAFHKNLVIIAIPGTQNARDVKMDINAQRATMKFIAQVLGPDALHPEALTTKVHKGFYARYQEVIPDIIKDIQDHYGKGVSQDDLSILVTGHSAGGAVAVLVGSHLVSKNIFHTDAMSPIPLKDFGNLRSMCNTPTSAVKMITFGAPRVGNAEFAKAFNECVGADNLIRVINQGDPVPTVPPRPIFKHVGFRVKFAFDKKNGLMVQAAQGSELKEGWKHLKIGRFMKSFKASRHSATDYIKNIDFFKDKKIGAPFV